MPKPPFSIKQSNVGQHPPTSYSGFVVSVAHYPLMDSVRDTSKDDGEMNLWPSRLDWDAFSKSESGGWVDSAPASARASTLLLPGARQTAMLP